MQTSMLAIFGLVAAVIATPSYPGGSGGTPYVACPSLLYSQAECCATVVLGVANLDCAPPSSTPTSRTSFTNICASKGQQAACCTIPIAGQGVLCTTPN